MNAICSRILYELDHRNPILYVIPIQSILGKLPVVPVSDTGTIPHHLRNHFPGRPATAGRVPAMDVGCGLSTRGHWNGPVICNEAGRAVRASVVPRGERFHVNTLEDHVWGTLLPALNDPCRFYLVLPVVEVFQQVPA